MLGEASGQNGHVAFLKRSASQAASHLQVCLSAVAKVDENETPIMPREFYVRCYTTSYLAFISITVAIIYEQYYLAMLGLMVFTTSVNYWRHPTQGARRVLDMAVVAAAFLVHVRHSVYILDKMHGPLYWILCSVGIGCYLKSKACGAEQDYHGDSLFHMLLHIIGNISNVVLYVGLGAAEA